MFREGFNADEGVAKNEFKAFKQSITEPCSKPRGRLVMYLQSSDKIFFMSVNSPGIPEVVGSGNSVKHCTVIIGHQENRRYSEN
ncbi:hypothetical protein BGV40_04515 [Methanosarcina sp. Ant1]|nr:hypothetical protein BGV40_04515 [Methanosarcina sp. Ant1]